MKVLSTDGLTKLIQLIKGSFISNTDVEQTSEISTETTTEITIEAYIVETYQNGSNWYRVWSDGWCEQGSIYTTTGAQLKPITLLKEMADTDYSIQMCNVATTVITTPPNISKNTSYPKSTTGFTCYGTNGSGVEIEWEVKGYAKAQS